MKTGFKVTVIVMSLWMLWIFRATMIWFFNGETFDMTITNKSGKFSVEIKKDTLKLGTKLNYEEDWMTLILNDADVSKEEYAILSSKIEPFQSSFSGKAILANGDTTGFKATQKAEETSEKEEEENEEEEESMEMLSMSYPNLAYGRDEASTESQRLLIKNATVITGESQGTLENTDVLLKDGKIDKIGKDLSDKRAKVIDGTW